MAEVITIAFSFEILYSSCVYSASLVLDEIEAIKNPIVAEQAMQSTIPLDRPTLPEPALTTTRHPIINEMTTTSSSSFISPVDEVNAFLLREAESFALLEHVATLIVNDISDSFNNDPPPPYSIEDRS